MAGAGLNTEKCQDNELRAIMFQTVQSKLQRLAGAAARKQGGS